VEIKVGDYGTIDKATGAFRRRGNIYDDAIIIEAIPNLSEYKPIVGEAVDHHEIVVGTTEVAGIQANAQVTTPSGTQPLLDSSWGFRKHRGAVFVMRDATVTSIPITIPDAIIEDLIRTHALKGMGIVTAVWKCSGYVRYLSSKGGDNFSVKLVADVAVPLVPISAGGGLSSHWECTRGAGSFKRADPRESPIYSGMFSLKLNERKSRVFFRGTGMPPEGEGCEKLGDYRPPWEDDEDFEEDDDDFDGDNMEVDEGEA